MTIARPSAVIDRKLSGVRPLSRALQCLDKEGALHEEQAGFTLNRGCMDNVYTLNEIVQGRQIKKEHYMRNKLALHLTEVAWIMCTL